MPERAPCAGVALRRGRGNGRASWAHRREADHHPSVLDAHLEGGLIVAKSRVGQVASGAELERVLVAGAHHRALLLVQPAAGEQATGVVAGVVHGGDPLLVAREQHQPLPHLEAAELAFAQIGGSDVDPTLPSRSGYHRSASCAYILGGMRSTTLLACLSAPARSLVLP